MTPDPPNEAQGKAVTVLIMEWFRSAMFYTGIYIFVLHAFLYSENYVAVIPIEYVAGLHPTALCYGVKILASIVAVLGFFGILLDCTVNMLLQRGVFQRIPSYLELWMNYQFVVFIMSCIGASINIFYLVDRGFGYMISFVILSIYLVYRSLTRGNIKDFHYEITEGIRELQNDVYPVTAYL